MALLLSPSKQEAVMSDDDDDDGVYDDVAMLDLNDLDPAAFEDFVAQRAIAFCYLVRVSDTTKDQTAKELTFTMMRKVNMSIRTPSTADLKVVDSKGGSNE
jgi:hypothetical protein